MAVLTDPDRAAVTADWQRVNLDQLGVTKAELRAALNAVDDWLEANESALNLAIPQPARAQLTTKQKAHLLMFVIRKKYGV